VTVSDLITAVNIALGRVPLSACQSLDTNHGGSVTVDELVAAVLEVCMGARDVLRAGMVGKPIERRGASWRSETTTMAAGQPDEGTARGACGPRTRAVLRLEGDFWTIAFGAELCRLRDSAGLRYLAVLLRRPGRPSARRRPRPAREA
jgi:hypothetical protein